MTRRFEILGVAGSGKSTLATVLVNDYDYQRPSTPSRLAHLPQVLVFLLQHCLPLLRHSSPGMRVQNFKLLLYCKAALCGVTRQPASMVIDQGVAFILGSLLRLGLEQASPTYRDKLMRDLCDPYLRQLDALVIVRVDREIALARVKARSSEHRLKHLAAPEQDVFFAYYEHYYDELVGRARDLSLPVLSLDSSATPVTTLATEIDAFVSQS